MLIIGIAGGTGSGKTTVVRKIIESLPAGQTAVIPQDSYYWDSSHIPVEERQNINFDEPAAIDFDLLVKHLKELKAGHSKQTSAPQETITTWQRIKPWIYMAAMFCGLMFSVRVVVGPPKQDTPIFTAAETEQFSDEYIETILDHSMMDDYTLYQYLTDANSDMYN